MRVELASGAVLDLGTTEANPTIGIIDFSRRVTDDFGTTTVVQRGFARRMSVRFALPFDTVDDVRAQLVDLRATSALWIADDRFESLQVRGFYKEFDLDLAVPPVSFCSLTVEGLAEPTPDIDFIVDPAPDARPSTLRLLQPVAIDDAMLTASSVPETDRPHWVAGSYANGARVVHRHRIWESIAAANTAEPSIESGKWRDTGPTNRWSMFDDALGTATVAANAITVTVAPGTIDAAALLDVVGETVRLQVGDYDQTVIVDGKAITFLDLPLSDDPITVTVSDVGPVGVGTLLVGRLVALGTTEAAPSAGIIDFSRKETDDFGEVTVVERAWAKRMSAKALIRTDAVDVVVDRIAAVRARPSLWIADDGTDSLTLHGFFKDFSVEVGDGVSKLTLSIEGLSKAAPLATPLSDLIADLGADLATAIGENTLTPGAKSVLLIQLSARSKRLDALAAEWGAVSPPPPLADPRHAAYAAATQASASLAAYLATLSPKHNDLTASTIVNGGQLRGLIETLDVRLSALDAALHGGTPTGTPVGGTFNPATGQFEGGISAAALISPEILTPKDKIALLARVSDSDNWWSSLHAAVAAIAPPPPADDPVVLAWAAAAQSRSDRATAIAVIAPPLADTTSASQWNRAAVEAALGAVDAKLNALDTALKTRASANVVQPGETPPDRTDQLWMDDDGAIRSYRLFATEVLMIGGHTLVVEGSEIHVSAGYGWQKTSVSDLIDYNKGFQFTTSAGDPVPVARAIGDQWLDLSSGIARVWMGEPPAWTIATDQTAKVVPSYTGAQAIQIAANATGQTTTTLPRAFRLVAMQGTTNVSATSQFEVTSSATIGATINTTDDRGLGALTEVNASGSVPFKITYPTGAVLRGAIQVNRTQAPPTGSDGTGSGSGSSSATTADWDSPATTTHEPITPVMTVQSTSGGSLTVHASASFVAAGTQFANVAIKAQYRLKEETPGAWSDFGAEVVGSGSIGQNTNIDDYQSSDGYVQIEHNEGGTLLASSDYEVRLLGRLTTPNRFIDWGGDQLFVVDHG